MHLVITHLLANESSLGCWVNINGVGTAVHTRNWVTDASVLLSIIVVAIMEVLDCQGKRHNRCSGACHCTWNTYLQIQLI